MTAPSSHDPHYRGRFAPSPTGPLHFGSLVAALASYLDARAQDGQWLLRMEDIDPPREMPGAADAIIASLERHGLLWDGDILFQSRRTEAYADALGTLDAAGLLYPCYCSRKTVSAAGGIYPGTCRPRGAVPSALASAAHAARPSALRLRTEALPYPWRDASTTVGFQDLVLGPQQQNLPRDVGDFIVRRKDGLIAYQLAVVVDDIAQGISHVIRGSDLLESTAAQIFLFHLLRAPSPKYGHLPLALNEKGQKLSKQQGAVPIDDTQAAHNLVWALAFLGHGVPAELRKAPCDELLGWAISQWRRENIPRAAVDGD